MAIQENRANQDKQNSSREPAKKRQSKAKKGERARQIETDEDQPKGSSKAAVPKVGKHEVGAKNVRGDGLH